MRGIQGRGASLVVLATLVAVLLTAGPASAESLQAPPGFRLRASNGYSLNVLGFAGDQTGRSEVLVMVEGRSSLVIYSTRAADVTETSIEADLGQLGRIDVDFVPSGRARSERSRCGSESLDFDSGHYTGNIDFQGEGGYSWVHATSAPRSGGILLNVVCAEPGVSEGIGGHSAGARLTEWNHGRIDVEFGAVKNSPSRPVRFSASIEERRGSIQISRSVVVVAPSKAFTFDFSQGLAKVSPPPPFSGEAVYRRTPSGRPTWRGDLYVDFPGEPRVALVGTGRRAVLGRVVLNPGHPF